MLLCISVGAGANDPSSSTHLLYTPRWLTSMQHVWRFMSLRHAGKQRKSRNGMMIISNYVEAVERGLDELDVLGLDGEAERLQHQLGLRALEHAPSRRERLRDDRALRRSPLDAICNDTRHAEATLAPSSATTRSQCAGGEGGKRAARTHRGRTGWIAAARRTCRGWRRTPWAWPRRPEWRTRPRRPPWPRISAPAAETGGGAEWLDPRRGSGHGIGMERGREIWRGARSGGGEDREPPLLSSARIGPGCLARTLGWFASRRFQFQQPDRQDHLWIFLRRHILALSRILPFPTELC